MVVSTRSPIWNSNCLFSREWNWPMMRYTHRTSERNRRLERLMNGMKSGLKPLFLAMLLAALPVASVVCPLWMTTSSNDHTHCSQGTRLPEPCPLVVCQATSPYLTATSSPDIPVLIELPDQEIEPIVTALVAADTIERHCGTSAGRDVPVFLGTHSLRI